MKIKHSEDYREVRRRAYPTLEEQIGEIWAILEQLSKDSITVQEALNKSEVYQSILKVKAAIKKP